MVFCPMKKCADNVGGICHHDEINLKGVYWYELECMRYEEVKK